MSDADVARAINAFCDAAQALHAAMAAHPACARTAQVMARVVAGDDLQTRAEGFVFREGTVTLPIADLPYGVDTPIAQIGDRFLIREEGEGSAEG